MGLRFPEDKSHVVCNALLKLVAGGRGFSELLWMQREIELLEALEKLRVGYMLLCAVTMIATQDLLW